MDNLNKKVTLKEIFTDEANEDAYLSSFEFYKLMQAYRNAPISRQEETVKAFDNVKEWITNNYIARK